MGIEIDLNDLNISGNAEVMDNVKIRDNSDVHIGLKHLDISEDAKLLNNLEIDSILKKLAQQEQFMDKDSDEYSQIKKILSKKQWNKDEFIERVIRHITDFSQGILASIIANFLTK